MGYRWTEHNGEIALAIEASTETAIFEEAVAALGELLDDGAHGSDVWFDVAATGADRATLLANWLDELVFLAETQTIVPSHTDGLELGIDGLRTRVLARRARPRRVLTRAAGRPVFESIDNGHCRATAVFGDRPVSVTESGRTEPAAAPSPPVDASEDLTVTHCEWCGVEYPIPGHACERR